MTSTSGAVQSETELDPFGAEVGAFESNAAFQPRKFTSYERDANGTDEAMMRRYNRWHSRFDQPDPYDGSYNLSDPQSFNRYAYTQGDPVNFIDPTGLEICFMEDGRLVCIPDNEPVRIYQRIPPLDSFFFGLDGLFGPRRIHPVTEFEPRGRIGGGGWPQKTEQPPPKSNPQLPPCPRRRDPAYLNLNGGIGLGLGVTGGILINNDGFYPYGGFGVVSSPGVAVTGGRNGVSPGWNVGIAGGSLLGGAISWDSKNHRSVEIGATTPGFTMAPYYVLDGPGIYHRIRGDCIPQ
jgi:RHS repeat-associated protein